MMLMTRRPKRAQWRAGHVAVQVYRVRKDGWVVGVHGNRRCDFLAMERLVAFAMQGWGKRYAMLQTTSGLFEIRGW